VFGRRRKTPPQDVLWQDTMSGREDTPSARRFIEIPEIDRWRAIGQDVPPPPDRGAVLQRVRQLAEELADSIDESNRAALDRLVESWVARWIATVDTAYVDACSAVSVHYGAAAQLVVSTEAELETATDQLERAKRIRDAAYDRLAGTDQKG